MASQGWKKRLRLGRGSKNAKRADSRLEVERLEERQLMAQVGGGGLSTWELALENMKDLDQYSAAEIENASEWLVGFDPGTNASAVAGHFAPGSFQATPLIPNAYILTVDPASNAQTTIVNVLSNASAVDYFYPLVAQQQSTRFAPNDTHYALQWHLNNTGAGVDANLEAAWDIATGAGVVIAVVDDGVQTNHPDLVNKIRADLGLDLNGNDNNPNAGNNDFHGTAVAGVFAAETNNNLGVAGSGRDAEIAGIRLIAGPASDNQEATALIHQMQQIHIYNNSWGPADSGVLGPAGPLVLAAIQNGVNNGRGGLGSIYVWAGGNGRQNNDNVNYDAYANSRFTIAVGAVGRNGIQAPYSESGASLIVVAPSNSALGGIFTTDLTGSNGYNNQNPPDSSPHPDYTANFGGTSSAAPLVAGVVGLMLQVNPNLTYRDVQHILVNTAVQNDPGDPDWTTNTAGHDINHKYGFGMIDAHAAVLAAQNHANVGPEVTATSGVVAVNQSIPDNDNAGISSTATINESITMEYVEIVFNATHTYRGDLEIVLTSPSGTQSILAGERGDNGDNYTNWVFTSTRHWGEDSQGTWSITVRDTEGGLVGTFNNWEVRVYGTSGTSGTISYNTTPVDDATGVSTGTKPRITFNQAMQFGTAGTVTIYHAADNTVFEQFDVTTALDRLSIVGNTMWIDPTNDFAINTDYYIQITAGALFTLGNLSFDGITDSTSWSFSTGTATAPAFVQSQSFVVAPQSGGKTVQIRVEATGQTLSLTPFPTMSANVGLNTALGDVDADGIDDIVVSTTAGHTSDVVVYSGRTGAELRRFAAYPGFGGGVNVATGDVDRDGYADIITGAGAGGGPHVKVFSGRTGGEIMSFFAYDAGFRGGVSVAAGDINRDGYADVVTGAGAGGGPHVRVFSGQNGGELMSFFAYTPGFTGGVNVGAGDVNKDGHADVVTGAGAGGGPHVRVFSGLNGGEIMSFFAYDSRFAGGVNVSTNDVNGDGFADVITGAGQGGGPHVQAFSHDGRTLASFFGFAPTFTGGVRAAFSTFQSRALTFAGVAGSGNTPISQSDLASAFEAALGLWSSAGLGAADLSRLNSVSVGLSDLPGNILGLARENSIIVDATAAGHGWALPGELSDDGRVDLLTALTHELGHILGLDHSESGLMDDLLAAGVAHQPTDAELDRVFARFDY
jgi:subtilisin-like proprotein convertase family protein